MPEPAKVAIIGGGCAAMTAAFELTRPELRDRFDVTVYQLGWRLGGKGASGRGPSGRIEEHGLHVWLGFYENAFRLMRDCYEELDRDPATCPVANWRDAFFPDAQVGMADVGRNGQWLQWTALFPPAPGLPGDPLDEHNPFTMLGYLSRTLALLKTLTFEVNTRFAHQSVSAAETRSADIPATREGIVRFIERLRRAGVLGTTTGLIEAMAVIEVLVRMLSRPSSNPVLKLVKDNVFTLAIIDLVRDVARAVRQMMEKRVSSNDEARYVWEILDLVVAIVIGILREGLIFDPRGFDAINHKECRAWLLEHGASQRSVDSAFVRGLFDLAMAYPGGDERRPALAAGQAIRGSLRMFFTYRGALFWKMRAGMGDIVFAPLYEVLRRRGVKFQFFHRLENVGLSADGKFVETLAFDVQANMRNGGEYQPLLDVKGLPCWPASADFSQLDDGARMLAEGWRFESFWDRNRVAQKELRVTQDFDFVVLGVGVGAVPHLCREILARDQRWRDMVKHVTSVPSQAFQLWLNEDMKSLGWQQPAVTLSAFAKPFDTWADMGHVAEMEDWPEKPASIAYFCSVLQDEPGGETRAEPDYPARRAAEVKARAIDFLNTEIAHLWPAAMTQSGQFRWECLLAADNHSSHNSVRAFDSQFWTANVNPSDRYTLAPPGSMQYRISPLDETYDNLCIAGDWTDCGFNEGCVEAAVMSGRLAAHALCGSPALEQIIGYDHP